MKTHFVMAGTLILAALLCAACGDPGVRLERPQPTMWVHAEDDALLNRMQDAIEDGSARFRIVGPPGRVAGRVEVPVAEEARARGS